MANKKSTVKNETVEVRKSEEKSLEKKEEKKIDEVATLKAQLEEMKKAMEALINSKNETNIATNQIIVKNEEEEVIIGCRVLQGIGWADPTGAAGEIRLSFNEEQAISLSDMKRFFRQPQVKRLFEDGLCYFVEPKYYALFNIRKYVDLSDENLINILTIKDTNEIVRQLNSLTDNQKNGNIVNCIVFRICDMIRKNVVTLDYYTRKAIEDYFGMDFDRGIYTLNALDNIRF